MLGAVGDAAHIHARDHQRRLTGRRAYEGVFARAQRCRRAFYGNAVGRIFGKFAVRFKRKSDFLPQAEQTGSGNGYAFAVGYVHAAGGGVRLTLSIRDGGGNYGVARAQRGYFAVFPRLRRFDRLRQPTIALRQGRLQP